MKRNSASHQRCIRAYLKPKNYLVVEGMAAAEGISKSETINYIVSQFAKRLPEHDRIKYITHKGGTLSTEM